MPASSIRHTDFAILPAHNATTASSPLRGSRARQASEASHLPSAPLSWQQLYITLRLCIWISAVGITGTGQIRENAPGTDTREL